MKRISSYDATTWVHSHLVCSSARRCGLGSHSLRHRSRPRGCSPRPPRTQTGPSCTPRGLKKREKIRILRSWHWHFFCTGTILSAELSIPRLCLTPNKILVSTYTLRPIVSALTIFQNSALDQLELVKTFAAKYQLWWRWGGRGEGGDGLRRWEGWRLPEMEKRVGSYSPNFAEWFDNPLVFSNEPYNKFSRGFSR